MIPPFSLHLMIGISNWVITSVQLKSQKALLAEIILRSIFQLQCQFSAQIEMSNELRGKDDDINMLARYFHLLEKNSHSLDLKNTTTIYTSWTHVVFNLATKLHLRNHWGEPFACQWKMAKSNLATERGKKKRCVRSLCRQLIFCCRHTNFRFGLRVDTRNWSHMVQQPSNKQ